MNGIWARIAASLRAQEPCALVSVLEVKGSSPREAGARMIVSPGAITGSIGGGALEWQALAEAQAMLGRDDPAAFVREYALGPDLGQCCGGRVSLLFEIFRADDLEEASRLAQAEAAAPIWIALDFSAERPARKVVRPGDVPAQDAGAGALRLGPRKALLGFGPDATPVYLFGAGHVGRALMLALAQLPFRLRLIDSRVEALPRTAPANVTLCHSAQPAQELAGAPDGAFVLIMTHSHPLDQEITLAALADRRFAYVGLIGSATKRARFEKRLREAGLPDDDLDRLVCPVGLTSIRSKEPAAIAISVAAQLLERREAAQRGKTNKEKALHAAQ